MNYPGEANGEGKTDNMQNNNDYTGGNSNNKVLVVFLIILLIGALSAAYFFYQRSQAVAVVNGERITKEDFYQAMISYHGEEILEEIINRKLILQEGRRLGVSVAQEDVDDEIDMIIEQFDSEEEFLQTLEFYGDTLEDLRDRLEIDILLREIAMYDYEMNEDDLKAFFTEHRMWFDKPEEIRLSHILVDGREDADEVMERLQQGEDFADLAAELSIDTFTRDNGGDIGFVRRGDMAYEFDELFEEAAFSLETGEISEPVGTYRGIHIIKQTDRNEGREVTFEEVKDDVKHEYEIEIIGPMINELIERLRNEAEIEKFL